MGRKSHYIAGMRRLFTSVYTIKKSILIHDGQKQLKAGKIEINSQRLRSFIGKKVRVIVYVGRKEGDTKPY